MERLQSLLLNTDDLDAVLTELAGLTTEVVGPTSCGITLRYQGNLLTVGSSDDRARLLDETQYRADDGPCLESLRTGRIIDIPDSAQERRWPGYLPDAVELGMRCSLSLPLSVGGETFGAMNVYGFEAPYLFGEPERRQLELFAARAVGTLQVVRRINRDSALLAQMDEAMSSRTVIDQAIGIIMGQQLCTSREAFGLIRRESQNTRRRLHDIATDLVAATGGEAPGPGRSFDTS